MKSTLNTNMTTTGTLPLNVTTDDAPRRHTDETTTQHKAQTPSQSNIQDHAP